MEWSGWHSPPQGHSRGGSKTQGRQSPLPYSPRKQAMWPRTLCQESWWLKEPCHCGQTLRLPENKQRRGLEATVETGRHDLPSQTRTKTGHWTSHHLRPAVPQEEGVGHTFAKMGLVLFLPSTSIEHHLYARMVLDIVWMV